MSVLTVIDIRDIYTSRPPYNGDFLGLAYNPDADVLYLSRGHSPNGGFIHTIDMDVKVLNEWDFEQAYRSGFHPQQLTYDSTSGHLFVAACNMDIAQNLENIVEMSPDGTTIFSEFASPIGIFSGMHVRADGVWLAQFRNDKIYHCDLSGSILSSFSVSGSFARYPGPSALTSSFTGGFFIVDHFQVSNKPPRIVEVNIAGTEVATVSTADLGDGRGMAIDVDLAGKRIFLLVNNEEIYVLSSDFI